jgi:hypothetical protein
MVEVSSVAGTLENAKHYAEFSGRVMRLSNGWLFDCQSYLYLIDPHADVAVFAKTTDQSYRGRPVVFYNSLTHAREPGGMQTPRGQALVGLISHNMNEYGQMVILMRLKGVTPPSTERTMKK